MSPPSYAKASDGIARRMFFCLLGVGGKLVVQLGLFVIYMVRNNNLIVCLLFPGT